MVPVVVGSPEHRQVSSGLEHRKDVIDTELDALRREVAEAKSRESVLLSDLSAANAQIGIVSQTLAAEEARLLQLEGALKRREARLRRLRTEFSEQTNLLRRQLQQGHIADEALEQRVVALYKSGGAETLIEILLGVRSLADAIDDVQHLRRIAQRDQEIIASVHAARLLTRLARQETRVLQEDVAEQTQRVSERTQEQRAALDVVAAREQELHRARSDKRELLASVRTGRAHDKAQIAELERTSAQLERRIIAARRRVFASASFGLGARPESGFILPVNGVLTSPFGPRWGRLHAGIDVGAPFGTPIVSVASGVVIDAGWLGSYGNLVVVDHGNGLSTAYAHQQRIVVSVGDRVSQGAVLGEVGSTRFSTGPHLHFEVRVNGVPHDPLDYL